MDLQKFLKLRKWIIKLNFSFPWQHFMNINHWRSQYQHTEVLFIKVSPFTRISDQFSTPDKLFVFSYSYLKLPECLCTTWKFGKMNGRSFTNLLACHCGSNYIACFWFTIKLIIKALLKISLMKLSNNKKFINNISPEIYR